MPVATVGARRSRRSLKGAPVAAVQVVPASGESVAREAAVKAVVKAESVDSRKRRPPARRAKVLTPAQQAALKKRRLELNRQAAVKSRKKKKEAIAGMKQALANMKTENKHLWDDNKLLNSAYAQLQGAYSKSFEDVVALRQNLNTMRNAFESLVSDLGGSAPDAVAKAKAKIAPAVEFLQKQQLAAGKRPQLSATQLPVAIVGGRPLNYNSQAFAERFPATHAASTAGTDNDDAEAGGDAGTPLEEGTQNAKAADALATLGRN